jgi:hypothetical protein
MLLLPSSNRKLSGPIWNNGHIFFHHIKRE